MRTRRAILAGAGAGLAVSLPAALIAQILAAVTDDDPPAAAVVGLAAAAVAGAILGGWTVRRLRGGPAGGLLAGATALGVVAALGVLRRVAAGDPHGSAAVLAAAVLGGLAGGLGWALGPDRAARTRP